LATRDRHVALLLSFDRTREVRLAVRIASIRAPVDVRLEEELAGLHVLHDRGYEASSW
jgi:hypothetical protein